jgi:phosphate transport system protein
MRTVTSREHTNREYEQELRRLREQLLLMGAKIEEMIRGSIRALVERETALAEQMISFDKRINQLELEIDEQCMQILARRQPVASDLRFITMALKLVTDLERIGDLGVNICERVVELNAEPPLKPYIDIPRMTNMALEMLRDALDCFLNGDVEKAIAVCHRDAEVDLLNKQLYRELSSFMVEDPATISRALELMFISKSIERIADHATNIAEEMIFLAKGENVRHTEQVKKTSSPA